MAEYIDREAAITAIRTAEKDVMADYGPEYGSEWGFSEEKAVEIVNSIPAADVAPVVHGKRIKNRNHRWKRSRNGEIDFFAWDSGYCNGPRCLDCGEFFCIHCAEKDKGGKAVKRKLESETCEEKMVCSVCGRSVPEDAPYCHCGAKMDLEE